VLFPTCFFETTATLGNLFLSQGHFTNKYKFAVVDPVCKKPNTDQD